jgi:branched-chain amino acid transport system ATP-binding protein
MTAPALTVQSLDAGYGEVAVLRGVTLTAAAGQITAIIGANGAGKTTLMRALAGLITPTAGQISVDGHPVTTDPPHRRVAKGVVLVPEGRLIFP